MVGQTKNILFLFLYYTPAYFSPRVETNKSLSLSKKFLPLVAPWWHYSFTLLLFFTLCIASSTLKFMKIPHFLDASSIQTWGAEPVVAAQECKSSVSCPKLLHRNDCLGLHHQHYCCSMKEKNKTNINGRDGRTAVNTKTC